MDCPQGGSSGDWRVSLRTSRGVRGAIALVLVGALSGPARAQLAPTAPSALIFDSVTVIDVEHGTRRPAQRVVIVGNRIQAVGDMSAVKLPTAAQVVDARGKYLIPGLWDLHVHTITFDMFDASHQFEERAPLVYRLLLAQGVTGIRDAGSQNPLDTLRRWRQEILAGTRLGPPRQILSGRYLNGGPGEDEKGMDLGCSEKDEPVSVCADDPARARHLVDSLKAAGADMIKLRKMGRNVYFAAAAEARRIGIPFGGHVERQTAIEASDSGARIQDHIYHRTEEGGPYDVCLVLAPSGVVSSSEKGNSTDVEQCRQMAERFRRNGTWLVPTRFVIPGMLRGRNSRSQAIYDDVRASIDKFWSGSALPQDWLRQAVRQAVANVPIPDSATDSLGDLRLMRRVGMPILAGTDAPADGNAPSTAGFALHAELAMYVVEGLTPLEALQTATLNPAKMLGGTDSLGTVAPGKLADLVLLDADPLVDITNTTAIRAVVANGRYFDRGTLDSLLTAIQTKPGEP